MGAGMRPEAVAFMAILRTGRTRKSRRPRLIPAPMGVGGERFIEHVQDALSGHGSIPFSQVSIIPRQCFATVETSAFFSVGTSPLDVGTSPLDVGTSPLDVGTSPLDVGTSPLDVRTSPLDVRTSPLDVGPSPLDVGPSPLDVGPSPLEVGQASGAETLRRTHGHGRRAEPPR